MIRAVLAMAVALPAVISVPAKAAGTVELGTLLCDVTPKQNLLVASLKTVDCTYYRVGGDPERYAGTVTRLGIDIGVTSGAVLSWVVAAPANASNGALEGNYYGLSGEATVGAGVSANVLVGGLKKSVTLQPVSFGGQLGLSLAVSVAEMELIAR